MTSEKDVEAVGTDEEKQALKQADTSADGSLPGLDGHDANDSRARFISGNTEKSEAGAEAYVDVNGRTKVEDTFVGLSKDELMKFADDPYWKKVRLAMLILFWVGWAAMLVAAILIIVLAPKCPPRPKLDWFQKATVYQLVPMSFRDSNGDGIGDLKGIHDNLDYLQGKPGSLNVTALLLNPIHSHGGVNNLYDPINLKDVTPEFGTMEEFEELRVALHKRNIALILAFLPHHTSDQHEWFKKSRKREGKYTDYYVWHPKKNGGVPNNWQARGGGSAWHFDDVRQEYYLGQFDATRPDLDHRTADVTMEIEEVLEFWMEKGVDGFNAEGAHMLFECANFTDDQLLDPSQELSYNNLDHSCTSYQPESYQAVTRWREVIDDYSSKKDKAIYLLINSQGTNNQTAMFYEYDGKPGAHDAANRNLLSIDKDCGAQCVYDLINSWMEMTTAHGLWNNWRLGDSHHPRILSHFDNKREMINALNLLVMTLPGAAHPYYGEEIGMHDLDLADLPAENHEFELPQTPLQWSPDTFAGFTEGNGTWIPIPDDYIHYNIKSQKAHGGSITNLEVFQSFVELREEPSIQWGDLEVGVAENVLFYVRQAEGFPGFLVAINFGPSQSTVDFVNNAPKDGIVPAEGKVVATTANFPDAGSDFDIGTVADLSNLILATGQGAVFKWEKDAV